MIIILAQCTSREQIKCPARSRHSHSGEEGPMQGIIAAGGQDMNLSLGLLAQAGVHTLPLSLFPRNEIRAHIHHKEGESTEKQGQDSFLPQETIRSQAPSP